MSPRTGSALLAMVPFFAVGLLLLSQSTDDAEEAAPAPRRVPDQPALVDPLPDYELNQANIVQAVTDAITGKDKSKLTSVLVKSADATVGLRAYFLAAMRAIPKRLKEDEAFSKEFTAYEAERLRRNEEEQKDLREFQNVARQLQVAVSKLIPVLGGVVLKASDWFYGWLRRETVDGGADASKARRAADQILPGYEGLQLRRGVSIEAGPDVPNLNRADQLKREAIRKEWLAKSEGDLDFLALPTVPDKQAFRFSPTYAEFRQAADEIRSGQ